jgi:hypothetical protein
MKLFDGVVAALMGVSASEARRILERNGVPVTMYSQRRWLVDAAAFHEFLADLEQQARERVEQRAKARARR